ncbi:MULTISPECIES: hypothetical protein [Clostridium]|uniref:hypothetical protein n=1 Tax=Clostridium TaxID=1485 RepID=UPI0008253F54|nr:MULTISPECIES: hypothetical protein [Clostridium]PJI06844.1 hypothetical protein CUB90_02710 [Clostridium sp. CT7]
MWECKKCGNKNPFTSFECLNCSEPLSKDKINEIVNEEIEFQKKKYRRFIINNADLFIKKSKQVNIALLVVVILIIGGSIYVDRAYYKSQGYIASTFTKLNIPKKVSSIQFEKLKKGNELIEARKKLVGRLRVIITKKNFQEKSIIIKKKIREAEEKLWD